MGECTSKLVTSMAHDQSYIQDVLMTLTIIPVSKIPVKYTNNSSVEERFIVVFKFSICLVRTLEGTRRDQIISFNKIAR